MLYAGVAAGILLVWGGVTHIKLVSSRRTADKAWLRIGAQLRRRHELIPDLMEILKAYAAEETSLHGEMVALRAEVEALPHGAPSKRLAEGEEEIGRAVSRALLLSERYPALKSDEEFIYLHEALYDAEEQLHINCRRYNGAVRRYMKLRENIPSLFVARLFFMPSREIFPLHGSVERFLPNSLFP